VVPAAEKRDTKCMLSDVELRAWNVVRRRKKEQVQIEFQSGSRHDYSTEM